MKSVMIVNFIVLNCQKINLSLYKLKTLSEYDTEQIIKNV